MQPLLRPEGSIGYVGEHPIEGRCVCALLLMFDGALAGVVGSKPEALCRAVIPQTYSPCSPSSFGFLFLTLPIHPLPLPPENFFFHIYRQMCVWKAVCGGPVFVFGRGMGVTGVWSAMMDEGVESVTTLQNHVSLL